MDDASRGEDDGDDAVSLLRAAGARPGPSLERTADARAFFDAAVRAELRQRRARGVWLQAAAVIGGSRDAGGRRPAGRPSGACGRASGRG